jgi:DNA modification methylase
MTKQESLALIQSYRNVPHPDNIAALKELSNSSVSSVAIASIEMLASYQAMSLLNWFQEILDNPTSPQDLRREAMSGIGRLRDLHIAANVLPKYLKDKNPEIVLQAIRGMLVFKDNPAIEKSLRKLASHPNEIIRYVIEKEFNLNCPDTETRQMHTSVNPDYNNLVVNGDSLKLLKSMPDATVHLTFTSPPYYNARDYSIYKSYEEYLDFLEEVFKETMRVTKDGRFLLVNTSPIIIPRVGRTYSSKRYPIPYDLHARLMKQGWEFVDDIIWLKPEASVKNRIASFLQTRKPLSYKPNAVTENIMVYRKPSHKLVDWNMSSYEDEIIAKSLVKGKFETNNVWKIAPKYDKQHTAVFPEALCDRVVSYYSMVGDLVFDPFAGSGTLGASALKLKRNILLSEIYEEYYNTIKENLKTFSDKLTFKKLK